MKRTPQINSTQALRQVEQLVQRIRSAATRLPESEAPQRRARAERDFFYFGRTYFPHYFVAESPECHREIVADWIAPGTNIDRLPRGFAKTTLAQIFILWCLLFDKKRFAIVIGKSADTAAEIAWAMVTELEVNLRIAQDFGEQQTDDWNADSGYRLKVGTWFLPLGRGGQMRGRKKGPHRPDLIVADDIEDEDLVLNPQRVKKLLRWWLQSVLPAMAEGGTAIWLCTSLSPESPSSLLLDPDWSYNENEDPPICTRKSFTALNVEGESIWPVVWPLERLAMIKAKIGTTAYNQEFLHLAEAVAGVFRREWFRKYAERDLKASGAYTVIVVDPSVKDKPKSDLKAVIVLTKQLAEDGYYIRHAWLRVASTTEMISKVFDVFKQYDAKLALIEMQGFAILLQVVIQNEEKRRGWKLPYKVIEQTIPKDLRIRAQEPVIERGQYHFLPGHSDQDKLIDQFVYYPKAAKDDGPDACAMGYEFMKHMGLKSRTAYQSVAKRTKW